MDNKLLQKPLSSTYENQTLFLEGIEEFLL